MTKFLYIAALALAGCSSGEAPCGDDSKCIVDAGLVDAGPLTLPGIELAGSVAFPVLSTSATVYRFTDGGLSRVSLALFDESSPSFCAFPDGGIPRNFRELDISVAASATQSVATGSTFVSPNAECAYRDSGLDAASEPIVCRVELTALSASSISGRIDVDGGHGTFSVALESRCPN